PAATAPAGDRSNCPTRGGEGPSAEAPEAAARRLLLALPAGVTTARDLFEAVREASRDAEYIKRRLERMESGEGVRAASLARSSSGSRADVNGTARVDARIDYEARVTRRQEENYALLDLACAILYGDDARGGLAALLSTRAADLLWHHYLCDESWESSAAAVGCNVRTAYREADKALDLLDMYGIDLVRSGRGAAEDE
ncbi:hypothetical protein, partial [uncultured Parolsenella sp.]|uniref:hypothetical protein n=1 Tax=uncultured Parolsenella sp. TaxID=2083008 RepID=UPI0027D9BC4A